MIRFFLTEKSRFIISFLFVGLLIFPVIHKYSSLFESPKKQGQKKEKKKAEDDQKKAHHWIAKILQENRTDIKSAKLDSAVEAIYDQSVKYGYDPLFILAIIQTESSFLNRAVSRVGARGLMQIRPATGREIARKKKIRWKGLKTLHTPWSNVEMGMYYLYQLTERFDGDIRIALEAYNNGPTRIRRLMIKGEKPHFRYTNKVLNNYQTLFETYGRVN